MHRYVLQLYISNHNTIAKLHSQLNIALSNEASKNAYEKHK